MCRSGCRTQDCGSYANCARGVRVLYSDSVNYFDATREKKWNNELAGYRDAVAEGLEPRGTTWEKIDAAKRAADVTGNAEGLPSEFKEALNLD